MVTNTSTVSGFLLLGFSGTQEIQILQALLFLVMCLLGLAGNVIIITITAMDPELQSPLYFFLKHLSMLDLSSLSVTVPQSIHNSLTGSGYNSYAQCVLQIFFFTSTSWSDVVILIVMSYDRYVTICLPLYYEGIMSPQKYRWAVTAVWISGGISGTLSTVFTFSIRFCSAKIIHQIFCDIPQLLKLSCANDYVGATGVISFTATVAFVCFITFSYVQIFSAVLKMPSAEGQSNIFSTCLPQLFVVSFFLSTGTSAYLKPTSGSPTALDLMISIFYTLPPPKLSPIIYSLRNEVMKGAIRKLLLGEEFLGEKERFIFCLVAGNIHHKKHF